MSRLPAVDFEVVHHSQAGPAHTGEQERTLGGGGAEAVAEQPPEVASRCVEAGQAEVTVHVLYSPVCGVAHDRPGQDGQHFAQGGNCLTSRQAHQGPKRFGDRAGAGLVGVAAHRAPVPHGQS